MKNQITRRTFLKNSLVGLTATAFYRLGLSNIATAQAAQGGDGSILTAYFSHTGNTRYMADQIHARVGGKSIEIKAAKSYPQNDGECHRVAKAEQRQNARPELSTTLPDLADYDTVFIGYPCWWGTLPMPMFTFMELVDLSGKTLIPFTTHGGSGWGRGLSDLKSLAPGASHEQGLALYGSRLASKSSKKKMEAWLSDLGFSS